MDPGHRWNAGTESQVFGRFGSGINRRLHRFHRLELVYRLVKYSGDIKSLRCSRLFAPKLNNRPLWNPVARICEICGLVLLLLLWLSKTPLPQSLPRSARERSPSFGCLVAVHCPFLLGSFAALSLLPSSFPGEVGSGEFTILPAS